MPEFNHSNDNPNDYIITRKRKLYKFAAFRNLANCYSDQAWYGIKTDFLASNKPLTIEIGAGTALFLTKLAQIHPERQFIAIDRKSDRLYTGAKLANELKLDNIIYIWSNAHSINQLLPAQSISEVWITFPDPWPQDSNAKHRLTNAKFLSQYHKLLNHQGTINFKTDNRQLFDWSVTQFDSKLWQIKHLAHDLHHDTLVGDDTKIMTTYEERYVREGKSINYLQAIKLDQ